MPLIFGLICLALGISLAVVWWTPAFVAALQVLLVIALLFCGLVLSLVGYSAIKADREFREAVSGDGESRKSDDSDGAPAKPSGS
jgi:hypothetical protein